MCVCVLEDKQVINQCLCSYGQYKYIGFSRLLFYCNLINLKVSRAVRTLNSMNGCGCLMKITYECIKVPNISFKHLIEFQI